MQEQTAQLLMQVAGRAGRRGNESKVFLQTRLPDHPLLKKFTESDYEDVAKSMLSERKNLSLSPYVNQVYLKAEDANLERLKSFWQLQKIKLLQEILKPMAHLKALYKKNLISIECFV